MIIYLGKMNDQLRNEDGTFLVTEIIGLTHVHSYLQQGHRLFVDNFYTSPHLAEHLLNNEMKLIGTMRSTRTNFPHDLVNQEIDKGQASFYKEDQRQVLAVKYRAAKDKSQGKPKIVYPLSTDHEDVMLPTRRRYENGNAIQKPESILHYNSSMGGVDVVDQQLHQLQTVRKTYKWAKKVFMRLVSNSLLNAQRLYKFQGGRHEFLTFVHDVLAQMIAQTPRLQRNRHADVDNIARLVGREHFPSKREYDGAGDRRKSKKKICRVCWAKGVRTNSGRGVETVWICTGCPSEPGLSLGTNSTCFRDYHTKFDYST